MFDMMLIHLVFMDCIIISLNSLSSEVQKYNFTHSVNQKMLNQAFLADTMSIHFVDQFCGCFCLKLISKFYSAMYVFILHKALMLV